MNILDYKKPAFWISVVVIIAVIISVRGLMINLPKEQLEEKNISQNQENHLIGYISKFEGDKTNATFYLDQIEWLTEDDEERLKELNINTDDLPNGFYIHNPESNTTYFETTDETQYSIVELGETVSIKSVAIEEFTQYLSQYSDYSPPFRIVTKDGYVQSITEQYLP
ncbi:MAG: hypothetical protein K0Q99_1366 [Clostridia bacterium]|jgi:hypothetical protein|nr:hypothetical protein [Clostridia bacterium]